MGKEMKWLLEEKYNGEKTSGFFTDCESLLSGVPLAYVIGSVPFLNTKIHLDSHPLIPRTETEFWVEKAIAEIVNSKINEPKILDLCAGSGCIGVAVLSAIDTAFCDFIEIDPAHQATIQKNCRENSIGTDRYGVFEGDLFKTKPGTKRKYDFILSNPPYIDSTALGTEKSVLEYEPHIALFGGTGGFSIIERILEDSSSYLEQNGILYIEHEPAQAKAIAAKAKSCGLQFVTHTDQYGVARYTRLSVTQ